MDSSNNIAYGPLKDEDIHWQNEIWTKAITIVRRPTMRGSELITVEEKTIDGNAVIPKSESLQDCAGRVLPLWKEDILPRLIYGQTVLIVAHSNTIRGMVKHLDNISDDNIQSVVIPSGIPLIYSFEICTENISLLRSIGKPSAIGNKYKFFT